MAVMKALRFEQYGPPSVLSVQAIPVPVPRDGEVLIEVHASAINPSDVGNVAGAFHASLPRTPGRDYAGVVIAGNEQWSGKHVWGTGPGFGVHRDGAHAQFVCAPMDALSEKPGNLPMEAAAAIGVAYLAAWSALVDAAEIKAGETVLIIGAAGAVGRAATQIAHWMGATVIGAERGGKSSEADVQVNSQSSDLPGEVRRLTNGAGADVVLDCVGGPMFEPSLNSLRRGGRQVAIASRGNRRVEFDLVEFYHEQKHLMGVDTMKLTGPDTARILDRVGEGFEAGHLKPPPTEARPLSEAPAGYAAVKAGGGAAKQVLLPQS